MRCIVFISLLLLASCQDDTKIALQDWVIVNYWAIWCGPCREEIPELNRFSAANKDSVTVIGVNADGVSGAELQEQIKELDIRFASPPNPPAFIAALKTPAQLPTTLVFYKGELRATLLGPQTLTDFQAAVTEGSDESASTVSPSAATRP